jgi:hypothetical protein
MGRYFYSILNLKERISMSVAITESLSDNCEVSSPKYREICTIINKLNSNKAAGSDSIPPELLKNG